MKKKIGNQNPETPKNVKKKKKSSSSSTPKDDKASTDKEEEEWENKQYDCELTLHQVFQLFCGNPVEGSNVNVYMFLRRLVYFIEDTLEYPLAPMKDKVCRPFYNIYYYIEENGNVDKRLDEFFFI